MVQRSDRLQKALVPDTPVTPSAGPEVSGVKSAFAKFGVVMRHGAADRPPLGKDVGGTITPPDPTLRAKAPTTTPSSTRGAVTGRREDVQPTVARATPSVTTKPTAPQGKAPPRPTGTESPASKPATRGETPIAQRTAEPVAPDAREKAMQKYSQVANLVRELFDGSVPPTRDQVRQLGNLFQEARALTWPGGTEKQAEMNEKLFNAIQSLQTKFKASDTPTASPTKAATPKPTVEPARTEAPVKAGTSRQIGASPSRPPAPRPTPSAIKSSVQIARNVGQPAITPSPTPTTTPTTTPTPKPTATTTAVSQELRATLTQLVRDGIVTEAQGKSLTAAAGKLPEAVTQAIVKMLKEADGKEKTLAAKPTPAQAKTAADQAKATLDRAKRDFAAVEKEYQQAQRNGLATRNPDAFNSIVDRYNGAIQVNNDAIRAHNSAQGNIRIAETDARELRGVRMAKSWFHATVQSGRLESLAARGTLTAPQLATLVGTFMDQPRLAEYALDLAATVPHPAQLADGIKVLAPLVQNGFVRQDGKYYAHQTTSEGIALNALQLGGLLGGSYFADLGRYYAADKHSSDPPLLKGAFDAQTIRQANSREVAATMHASEAAKLLVGSDGSPQLSASGLADLMASMKFHPTALINASPEFLRTMQETLHGLRPGTDLHNAVFKGVGAPTNETGKQLVRQTLGLPPGAPVGAAEARQAVISALITPFHQGPVGSCFATAVCRKQWLDDPLAAVRDLSSMITTGQITKNGITMPIVLKLGDTGINERRIARDRLHEDPGMDRARQELGVSTRDWADVLSRIPASAVTPRQILTVLASHFKKEAKLDAAIRAFASVGQNSLHRAWEYTMASIGAAATNSSEKNQLTGAVFASGTGFSDALGTFLSPGDVTKAESKITEAIQTSFSFRYDPTLESGAAADGSSSLGGFVLHFRGASGLEPITDRATFLTRMEQVAQQALRDFPAAAGELGKASKTYRSTTNGQLIQSTLRSAAFADGVADAYGSGNAPWKLKSGGQSVHILGAAFGKTFSETPLDLSSPPSRPLKLLEEIVGKLGNSTVDHVAFRTVGTHSMNAIPKHPSLDALKTGAGTVRERIQNAITAGTPDRSAVMTAERTQVLFDKLVVGLVDVEKHVETLAKRPTTGLNLTQLRALVLRETSIKGEQFDAGMLELLDIPKFVFADTNWGGASERVVMAVAPHPMTGEPRLWKVGELSGGFSLLEDTNWINKDWSYLS